MKIILAGMHRSGINCVGRWLLRQSGLREAPLCSIYDDWVEQLTQYIFLSQVNHPDHFDKYMLFLHKYEPEYTVMTIEREGMGVVQQFQGLHPDFKVVLIVREFKNWVASVCNMNKPVQYSIPHIDMQKYANLISHEGPRIIKYDQWCVDKEYRHHICDELDLEFTDCGFNHVPSNGGGSSFDGMEYQGRGSKMNTTERYKACEDSFEFQNLLDTYRRILDLSDDKFRER